jgi:hypothetical protein
LTSLSYIRVLPERVPELEAQGWHAVAAASFSDRHGYEVVMVRLDEDHDQIPDTQGND